MWKTPFCFKTGPQSPPKMHEITLLPVKSVDLTHITVMQKLGRLDWMCSHPQIYAGNCFVYESFSIVWFSHFLFPPHCKKQKTKNTVKSWRIQQFMYRQLRLYYLNVYFEMFAIILLLWLIELLFIFLLFYYFLTLQLVIILEPSPVLY